MEQHISNEETKQALKHAWQAFETTLKIAGMSKTQWDAFVFEFGSSGGYELVDACFAEFWKDE